MCPHGGEVKLSLVQHTPLAVGNNEVGVGIPSTHSGQLYGPLMPLLTGRHDITNTFRYNVQYPDGLRDRREHFMLEIGKDSSYKCLSSYIGGT